MSDIPYSTNSSSSNYPPEQWPESKLLILGKEKIFPKTGTKEVRLTEDITVKGIKDFGGIKLGDELKKGTSLTKILKKILSVVSDISCYTPTVTITQTDIKGDGVEVGTPLAGNFKYSVKNVAGYYYNDVGNLVKKDCGISNSYNINNITEKLDFNLNSTKTNTYNAGSLPSYVTYDEQSVTQPINWKYDKTTLEYFVNNENDNVYEALPEGKGILTNISNILSSKSFGGNISFKVKGGSYVCWAFYDTNENDITSRQSVLDIKNTDNSNIISANTRITSQLNIVLTKPVTTANSTRFGVLVPKEFNLIDAHENINNEDYTGNFVKQELKSFQLASKDVTHDYVYYAYVPDGAMKDNKEFKFTFSKE